MPCKPTDYSIPPGNFDEPSIPGFGSPIDSGLEIPGMPVVLDGIPADIAELIESLKLLLPGGPVKPNLNPNIDEKILDAILKLLDYLTPFLAIYKMILPILNMIICIIEVLCALKNPFKLIKALRKLFRTCIPDFLALFPYFAFILMIISLILLILALIQYIIAEIIRIINQILKNIKLLARIAKRKDANGILTAARKVGALLCYLKNLFAVLQIVALIIQIIKDILSLSFRIPPCDDADGDDDGCCTEEVCPAFIKQADFTRSTGTLQYLREIGQDASGITGLPAAFGPIFASLGAIRQESWQFYDVELANTFAFYNITSAVDVDPELGFTFFPVGKTYEGTSNVRKVPYTVDLRVFYYPAAFGLTDPLGSRYIRIKDCIVKKTPIISPLDWQNQPLTTPVSQADLLVTKVVDNGSLDLLGGLVYEDDGSTAVMVGAAQGTLTTFVHLAGQISNTLIENPIFFSNVEYTFKINHSVLVGEDIITLGCVPEVAFDRTFVNTNAGAGLREGAAALAALPIPDPAATQECLAVSLAKFGASVTAESAATFQAETTTCLNAFGDQLSAIIDDLVDLGFVADKSTFSLTPTVQFTTLPIVVTATLNDKNGHNLCPTLPAASAQEIADKLVAELTFGAISKFTYDGAANFTAEINSEEEGSGEISLMYNNTFFSTLSIPADLTVTPTTGIQTLTFEFVKTPVGSSAAAGGGIDSDGKPRRNDGDVSGDGE